jgi:3-oxoacyl-[acyl-carrier protein] reductase
MDLGLNRRHALVTGAGRGIGAATARRLAGEGARVTLAARSHKELASTLKSLSGEDHLICAVDLTTSDGVEALKSAVAQRPVDILVNNLGGPRGVSDPFASIDDYRAVMRLNFEVAVELSQGLVPAMMARGWGRVVNVSSVAAVELNGPPSYAAAKAALCAYTRCVGRYIASSGVVMSAILPGAVQTEGGYWDDVQRDDPDRYAAYVRERCPLGRLGSEVEIADLICFLSSERASFNAGSVLPADGGQLRGYVF